MISFLAAMMAVTGWICFMISVCKCVEDKKTQEKYLDCLETHTVETCDKVYKK